MRKLALLMPLALMASGLGLGSPITASAQPTINCNYDYFMSGYGTYPANLYARGDESCSEPIERMDLDVKIKDSVGNVINDSGPSTCGPCSMWEANTSAAGNILTPGANYTEEFDEDLFVQSPYVWGPFQPAGCVGAGTETLLCTFYKTVTYDPNYFQTYDPRRGAMIAMRG